MITIIDKMLEDYFKWLEDGGDEESVRCDILRLIEVKQILNLEGE